MPLKGLTSYQRTIDFGDMEKERRYPVGIQTFSRLRKEGYVYIDKTDLMWQMTRISPFVFLGRPRRFGPEVQGTGAHEGEQQSAQDRLAHSNHSFRGSCAPIGDARVKAYVSGGGGVVAAHASATPHTLPPDPDR